jgi:hypothetical protein
MGRNPKNSSVTPEREKKMRTRFEKKILKIALLGILAQGSVSCGKKSSRKAPTAPQEVNQNAPTPGAEVNGTPSPGGVANPAADEKVPFEFAFPGIEGQVTGRVSLDGNVEIVDWPTQFKTKVQVAPNSVAEVDDSLCKDVARRVSDLKDSPQDYIDYKYKLVRNSIPFEMQIVIDPTLSNEFKAAAMGAAEAKRPGLSSYTLESKAPISALKQRLVFAPDALSQELGNLAELEQIFDQSQVDTGLGIWKGSTKASDLICDFRSGKAWLEYEIEENGFRAFTKVTEI